MKKTINGIEREIAPEANLREANLREADLRVADLRGANLREADLREADLRGANLREADLREADLRWANLGEANLCGADLYGANLCGANLWGADLRGADLRGANLYGANLCGANLWGADLSGADLRGAKNLSPLFEAMTKICAEGDIIGYKNLSGDVICKLNIPADAKRSNSTGRKCRAEYALVLEGEGVSRYDNSFEYKIGEIVRPREPFDDNRWEECASGIHFYLTREEAENHR